MIVSGAVTDRVLAAPDTYPREALFYAQLGHTLEPAFASSRKSPASPARGFASIEFSNLTG